MRILKRPSKKFLFIFFSFLFLLLISITAYFVIKKITNDKKSSEVDLPNVQGSEKYPDHGEYSTTTFLITVKDESLSAEDIKKKFEEQTNYKNITVTKVIDNIYKVETTAIALVETINEKDTEESKEIINKYNYESVTTTLHEEVSSLDFVTEAEPEYYYEYSYVPTDPMYSSQWAHKQTNAEIGWDEEKGSSETIIAILDSGVDLNHEDLKDNLWINTSEIEGNSVDDDNNGYIDDVHGFNFYSLEEEPQVCSPGQDCSNRAPMDALGHGTHCAGIAAAPQNSIGVSGVCPNCKIMALRTGNQDYLSTTAIVLGLQYAIDMGADIVNMSFGGDVNSPIMQQKITEAYNAGVILIAAAGNDGSAWASYPASYDQVLSVAATNVNKGPSFYTNWSNTVDVAAPGGDGQVDSMILSTVPKNNEKLADPSGYKSLQGTSMAAPYVSGLAGLIKSKHPDWSVEQIYRAIEIGSTRDIGSDNSEFRSIYGESGRYMGVGNVNVKNSLEVDIPLDYLNTKIQINNLTTSPYTPINTSSKLEGEIKLISGSVAEVYLVDNFYTEENKTLLTTLETSVSGVILENIDLSNLDEGNAGIYVVIKEKDSGKLIDSSITPFLISNINVTSPDEGTIIRNKSTLAVTGKMLHMPKLFWSVSNANDWKENGVTNKGSEGVLAEWNTSSLNLADGFYDLKIQDSTILSEKQINHIWIDSRIAENFPVDISLTGDFFKRVSDFEPFVADLDGDGKKEIILENFDFYSINEQVVNFRAFLEVFSSDGTKIWQYEHNVSTWNSRNETIAVDDINYDGKKEIILISRSWSQNGYDINALSSNGELLWKHEIKTGRDNMYMPAFAINNIDGKGDKEVIITNNYYDYDWSTNTASNESYRLTILGSKGEALLKDKEVDWEYDCSVGESLFMPNRQLLSPVIANIDQDSESEIIINLPYLKNKLFIFDRQGGREKVLEIPGSITTTVIASDVNNDQILDLVFGITNAPMFGDGTSSGFKCVSYEESREVFSGVIAMNSNGELLFKNEFISETNTYATSIIGADINNDNNLEFVAYKMTEHPDPSGQFVYISDEILILRNDGTQLSLFGVDGMGGSFYFSPILSNVDSDSDLEVIYGADYSMMYNEYEVSGIFAYNFDGTLVPNFPLYTERSILSTPYVGDLDNDNLVEIVATSPAAPDESGKLIIWNIDDASASSDANSWNMYLKDGTRNQVIPVKSVTPVSQEFHLSQECSSNVINLKVSFTNDWECQQSEDIENLKATFTLSRSAVQIDPSNPRPIIAITISNLARGPYCEVEGCTSESFADTAKLKGTLIKDGDKGEIFFDLKDELIGQDVYAAVSFNSAEELNEIMNRKDEIIAILSSASPALGIVW
jgi:subtilisin family serine protease